MSPIKKTSLYFLLLAHYLLFFSLPALAVEKSSVKGFSVGMNIKSARPLLKKYKIKLKEEKDGSRLIAFYAGSSFIKVGKKNQRITIVFDCDKNLSRVHLEAKHEEFINQPEKLFKNLEKKYGAPDFKFIKPHSFNACWGEGKFCGYTEKGPKISAAYNGGKLSLNFNNDKREQECNQAAWDDIKKKKKEDKEAQKKKNKRLRKNLNLAL